MCAIPFTSTPTGPVLPAREGKSTVVPPISVVITAHPVLRARRKGGDMASLYERLGGVYSIATVVDDFIDRIMVDPRLNANPKVDEAHHKVPPPGFKYLVTEMVCWATG